MKICFEIAGGSSHRGFELPGVDCRPKGDHISWSATPYQETTVIVLETHCPSLAHELWRDCALNGFFNSNGEAVSALIQIPSKLTKQKHRQTSKSLRFDKPWSAWGPFGFGLRASTQTAKRQWLQCLPEMVAFENWAIGVSSKKRSYHIFFWKRIHCLRSWRD